MDNRKFVSFVNLKRGEMVVDLDTISYVSTLEPDLYNLPKADKEIYEKNEYIINLSDDISETKYLLTFKGGDRSISISQEDYNKIKKILLDG